MDMVRILKANIKLSLTQTSTLLFIPEKFKNSIIFTGGFASQQVGK